MGTSVQQVGTSVQYIFELYLNTRNIYPFSCCYVTDWNRLPTPIQTADTLTLCTLRLSALTQTVATHTECGHSLRLWTLTQTLNTHSGYEHSLRLWTLTQTVNTHSDCEHSLRLWTLTQTVNTHSDCIVSLDSRKWSHWHSYQTIQLMTIKFFWDLILYHLVCSSQRFEVLQYLHCQGQVVTSWIAWPLRWRYHVPLNISNYISTIQCAETSDE